MNANITRTPRRRKDVPQSVALGEPGPHSAAAGLPPEIPLSADVKSDLAAAEPSTAVTVIGDIRVAMRSEQTRADIATLLDTAKAITAITNVDGRQQAHALLMLFVKARTTTDGRCDEVSAKVRSFLEDVRAERDDLKQLFAEQETRIRKLRDDWDNEQARIKRERAEAEQHRKQCIEARIEDIRSRAAAAIGKSSADIAVLIEQTTAVAVDDTFSEFKSKAESVQKMTLDKLRYFHQIALASDERALQLAEQERRLAAERERLAQQKQEQEVAAARERARIEEEDRQARLKREADEREHQEQLRRQREEEDRQAAARRQILADEERAAAERRAQREAEDARLASELAEVERLQEALRLQQESLVGPSDPVEATVAETVAVPAAVADEAASRKPPDEEIIHAVAVYFGETPDVAQEWIREMVLCHGDSACGGSA